MQQQRQHQHQLTDYELLERLAQQPAGTAGRAPDLYPGWYEGCELRPRYSDGAYPPVYVPTPPSPQQEQSLSDFLLEQLTLPSSPSYEGLLATEQDWPFTSPSSDLTPYIYPIPDDDDSNATFDTTALEPMDATSDPLANATPAAGTAISSDEAYIKDLLTPLPPGHEWTSAPTYPQPSRSPALPDTDNDSNSLAQEDHEMPSGPATPDTSSNSERRTSTRQRQPTRPPTTSRQQLPRCTRYHISTAKAAATLGDLRYTVLPPHRHTDWQTEYHAYKGRKRHTPSVCRLGDMATSSALRRIFQAIDWTNRPYTPTNNQLRQIQHWFTETGNIRALRIYDPDELSPAIAATYDISQLPPELPTYTKKPNCNCLGQYSHYTNRRRH